MLTIKHLIACARVQRALGYENPGFHQDHIRPITMPPIMREPRKKPRAVRKERPQKEPVF